MAGLLLARLSLLLFPRPVTFRRFMHAHDKVGHDSYVRLLRPHKALWRYSRFIGHGLGNVAFLDILSWG